MFAQPSFTTSPSGPALTGGYDASAIPNHPYITQYQYDTLGNLLCVHQKGADATLDKPCNDGTVPTSWRPRKFTYDSLSRLLTAYNPESGTISYGYDAAGNMTSKAEPAPNQLWGGSQTVTITYTYDSLNRLLRKQYSDGTTPQADFRYDYSSFMGQSFSYPVGRLVATFTANSVSYFTSYEKMGRVAGTTECVPGVAGCKTFTANYDKIGDLTTLVYPANNFSVTYSYDNAARLTQATDSAGVIYAQGPSFWATGAMREFVSPNFNNLKYHVDYNNRLQPTEIWTGSAQGAGALFDKQYTYTPNPQTHTNNGNILTITNVKDSTRTQTFSYDVLNRLISAQDQTHWANNYQYDPWGNLQKIKLPNVVGENLQIASDDWNHMIGYSYDASGNMRQDGVNSWTYVYDAENRITTAGSVTHTYDADGRRVRKSNGTNYWYGPSGAALAETDNSGAWTNYIFFAGQRLARNVNGDIKYYISDHLHSTGMFVDKNGTTVLDDNDFYPWGGVVPGVGVSSSTNHYKFTGKERDSESQLDYFGARYYSNILGRFISADWAAKPISVPYANFGDPQTLNLFSYVGNSPITRVDAVGHSFAGMDGFMRPTGGSGADLPMQSSPGSGKNKNGMAAAAAGVGSTGNGLAGVAAGVGAVLAGAPAQSGSQRTAATGVPDTAMGMNQVAAGVRGLTPPTLTFTIVAGCGPTDSFCNTLFSLDRPSELGGYIIQEIIAVGGLLHYWEAWHINPRSQYTDIVELDKVATSADDRWSSHGVTAHAVFYESLAKLPDLFRGYGEFGHVPQSGLLPSTYSDPSSLLPLNRASNVVTRSF